MGSLKTQISQFYKNLKVYITKNKQINKNQFIRRWLGRGAFNTCAKFQGLSKIACTLLDSKGIWGDKLEPACRGPRYGATTRKGRSGHPLSPGRLSRPCVQRPLVRENLPGGSCVLWLCASAPCAGCMGGGCAAPGMKTPPISIQRRK